jgi:4-hydroxybenzoate polyprenyltransferase
VPFLIYFAITLPWQATAWMVAYSLFFTFYSAPPLRFKARKYLDALSNTDYAFPLAFVPLALGVEPNWWLVAGLMAWSIAKHAYDAIQDIPQDSDTGIITTAVHLGPRKTAIWSAFWWAISTALFAVVNIPVAIANAIIAYLLVSGESGVALRLRQPSFTGLVEAVGGISHFPRQWHAAAISADSLAVSSEKGWVLAMLITNGGVIRQA